MKKFMMPVLLLLMGALVVGCGQKEEATETTEEQTTEETTTEQTSEEGFTYSKDKIVVGLDDTFAPMGFRDENNEIVGFDVDLMKEVSNELGIPFELQPITWSMKETELNNGNIDLIWNAYSITPEREEKVLFTKPYLENKQVVVVRADSDINTLADLSGKVVAAQAESSAVDAMESKPEIKDTFAELTTFETNNDCLMDLEAGRADAVVGDEVLINYYITLRGAENYKVLEENFGEELYGIGARKEDEALVAAIDKALDTIAENGKGAEISNKWFGSEKLVRDK